MFKRLTAGIVLAVIALAFTAVVSVAGNPHGNPPGNDGDPCHGANQSTCRPDPQPSHGQDCEDHGNNTDGNDDHCFSEAPDPTASPTPTPEVTPTPEPTVTPEPTGTPEPTQPEATPVPSIPDTAMAEPTLLDNTVVLGYALFAVAVLLVLIGLMRSVRS